MAPEAATDAAAGAVIRIAARDAPRTVCFGLPVLLIIATTVIVALLPAPTTGALFDLLLLPVLVAAVALGLLPGLFAVAVGAMAGTMALPPSLLPWVSDAQYPVTVGLYAAEGMGLALIGGIVRAALRNAGGAGTLHVDERVSMRNVPAGELDQLPVERLTNREVEVLRRAASGRGVEALAEELFVSPNTVKTHLAHCYDKLGAHNRAEAIAIALRSGSLALEDIAPNHPGG